MKAPPWCSKVLASIKANPVGCLAAVGLLLLGIGVALFSLPWGMIVVGALVYASANDGLMGIASPARGRGSKR